MKIENVTLEVTEEELLALLGLGANVPSELYLEDYHIDTIEGVGNDFSFNLRLKSGLGE